MKYSFETNAKLLITAAATAVAGVACSNIDSRPVSTPTPTTEIAPTKHVLPTIIPDTYSLPTLRPTPTEAPTPIPSLARYDLAGIQLNDTINPVQWDISLPDGTKLSSEDFHFITDPSGAGITGDLCQPDYFAHNICTYSDRGRNFILPHSGNLEILGFPFPAEALRNFVEGPIDHYYSPAKIAEQLKALEGATMTLTQNGKKVELVLNLALRIPPEHLAQFTRNFVVAPEAAAEIFPEKSTEILAHHDLYLQTCGDVLPDEKVPSGAHWYDSSRLYFLFDIKK